MDQTKLQEILQAHKKWLAGDYKEGARANLRAADLLAADLHGADLRGADLNGANLRGANLHGANLRAADLNGANLHGANLRAADLRGADLRDADLNGANLRAADLHGADLHGADLDFSDFPLWCGGLDVHIDDKLASQLLYHLLRNVAYSKNTGEELRSLLLTPELIGAANLFHRVDECGKIVVPEVNVNESRA